MGQGLLFATNESPIAAAAAAAVAAGGDGGRAGGVGKTEGEGALASGDGQRGSVSCVRDVGRLHYANPCCTVPRAAR